MKDRYIIRFYANLNDYVNYDKYNIIFAINQGLKAAKDITNNVEVDNIFIDWCDVIIECRSNSEVSILITFEEIAKKLLNKQGDQEPIAFELTNPYYTKINPVSLESAIGIATNNVQ